MLEQSIQYSRLFEFQAHLIREKSRIFFHFLDYSFLFDHPKAMATAANTGVRDIPVSGLSDEEILKCMFFCIKMETSQQNESVENVCVWLEKIGLRQYCDRFRGNLSK